MLAFLVEVLEKGMQQVQVPVLNIIHCMLHYIDLSSPHAQPISSDLIRVIAKYIDVSSLNYLVQFVLRNVLNIHLNAFESCLFIFSLIEFLLEGCLEDSEIGCNKKFNATSCTTRITWWNITSLLW